MTTTTHILGYPRIGEKRQLKYALEQYWHSGLDQEALLSVGSDIRQNNWQWQSDKQLNFVTVGDFAWYDHVLNTSLLLGHVPKRHRRDEVDMDTLFTVARGQSQSSCQCHQAAASDMTKWFNTNYHYIVPEFSRDDQFCLSWPQLFDEVREAKQLNHQVKPVLLGPVSYLYLGKPVEEDFDPLSLLSKLLPVYQQILDRLADLGVEWIQIDEPILALELDEKWCTGLISSYRQLQCQSKLLLATYFDSIVDNLTVITALKVDGVHIDLTVKNQNIGTVVDHLPKHWVLSAGVVNGRNVWRCDLAYWLDELLPIKAKLNDRLWIATSCSLLHCPVDVEQEQSLPIHAQKWFSFAKQKVAEVTLLANALDNKPGAREACIEHSLPLRERENATSIHKPSVQSQLSDICTQMEERSLPYPQRAQCQSKALPLPLLPTTTIGSFPQTREIRALRRSFRQGKINQDDYDKALKVYIHDAIKRQQALGLDVLVHGEPERNDMVEYFAEQLSGFLTTEFGWVQSYGSRCVKPAIIVGDIERTQPMTVKWITYAQSLTEKPVKGMLTGPVTILCWTFPREDISRRDIANQLALALREEVEDLQNEGIQIIQIDEPALREGMPLKVGEQNEYLNWAVRAFKLAAGVARPQTQIHTHMCYSEFNEIIDSVAALDADVITIETSRSNMELLNAFERFHYPNAIGPGVYDIHSPTIPDKQWMIELINKATALIAKERLWVNPDCGLKTRTWPQVEAALTNMVVATQEIRDQWATQDVDIKSKVHTITE